MYQESYFDKLEIILFEGNGQTKLTYKDGILKSQGDYFIVEIQKNPSEGDVVSMTDGDVIPLSHIKSYKMTEAFDED